MVCSVTSQKRTVKLNARGLISVPPSLSKNLVSLYLSHNRLAGLDISLPLLLNLNISHNDIRNTRLVNAELPCLQNLLIHHNPLCFVQIDYIDLMFFKFPSLRTCDGQSKSQIWHFNFASLLGWNGLGLQQLYSRLKGKVGKCDNVALLNYIKQVQKAFEQNQREPSKPSKSSYDLLTSLFEQIYLYFQGTNNKLFVQYLDFKAPSFEAIDLHRFKTDPGYRRKAHLFIFYSQALSQPHFENQPGKYLSHHPQPQAECARVQIALPQKGFSRMQTLYLRQKSRSLNLQCQDLTRKVQLPEFQDINRVRLFVYDTTYLQAFLYFLLNFIYKHLALKVLPKVKLTVDLPAAIDLSLPQRKENSLSRASKHSDQTLPFNTCTPLRRDSFQQIQVNQKQSFRQSDNDLFVLSASHRQSLARMKELAKTGQMMMGSVKDRLSGEDGVYKILLAGKVLQALVRHCRQRGLQWNEFIKR